MGPRERLEPDALVIVLIGASAVGKSTAAGHLTELGMVEATPTWTTRPPRRGETSTCYDHHFVSDDEFDTQDRKGAFMDRRELYGFRYGVPFLPRPPEGREALMVLKPLFMPKFIRHFPFTRIYQIEASTETVEERMGGRGQTPEDIARRMREHEAETAEAGRFAHFIINNDGAPGEMLAQIEERIRSDRELHDGGYAGDAVPMAM